MTKTWPISLTWEIHGDNKRVAHGAKTKFRIDPSKEKEGEFTLYEVLDKGSMALVTGSLEFCKGVAEGSEMAMMTFFATLSVAMGIGGKK